MTPLMLSLSPLCRNTESAVWQKRWSMKHVRAPMRLVQSAPSFCLTKRSTSESVSRFLRKCMIGSTLILIDFAEKASKNPGCKTQLGSCCFGIMYL